MGAYYDPSDPYPTLGIWKNRKRGTKGPEIVKMFKIKVFEAFYNFWEKMFFVKNVVKCGKYLFGLYNAYFFDLEVFLR